MGSEHNTNNTLKPGGQPADNSEKSNRPVIATGGGSHNNSPSPPKNVPNQGSSPNNHGKSRGYSSFAQRVKRERERLVGELLEKYSDKGVEEVLESFEKELAIRIYARGKLSLKEETELKAETSLLNKRIPDKHHTQVSGEVVKIYTGVPEEKK